MHLGVRVEQVPLFWHCREVSNCGAATTVGVCVWRCEIMKALIWVHERCTWVYVFHTSKITAAPKLQAPDLAAFLKKMRVDAFLGATTTYCRELMNVDFDTKPYRPGEPCACSCFCMDVAAMTAQVNVFSDACLSGFLVCWDEFLQDAQCNSRRYNLLQPLHEALSVSRFLDITATGTR